MQERQREIFVDGSVSGVRRSVLLSSIAEVVEWFDFMVYLSLAPVLARVFSLRIVSRSWDRGESLPLPSWRAR
jgi:hypothetical protein